MDQIIYISLKRHVRLDERRISFFDVADAEVDEQTKRLLSQLIVKTIEPSAGNVVVVTVLDVIGAVKTIFPEARVVIAGETEAIVSFQPADSPAAFWKIALVWIVLFTGAALTIMNFHEDVSMQKVHVLLYEKITGEKNDQPLLLQIPYSIGLGLGMILFFNRLWQKRLNEEPGPLDLEMFKYEEDINGYLAANEKEQK